MEDLGLWSRGKNFLEGKSYFVLLQHIPSQYNHNLPLKSEKNYCPNLEQLFAYYQYSWGLIFTFPSCLNRFVQYQLCVKLL